MDRVVVALYPKPILHSLPPTIQSQPILLASLPCITCFKPSQLTGLHKNGPRMLRAKKETSIALRDSPTWGSGSNNSCKSSSSVAWVCQAQASETVAVGRKPKVEHGKVRCHSTSVRSKKGTFWAREALEANLPEASGSSSSEETNSGDITINGFGAASTSTLVLDREPITGGAFDFHGAASPLTISPLLETKKIVLVRHGLSAWNADGRIQGSSDLSLLSEEGVAQAERCKQALANLKFSSCFASPISRARSSAEVIWRDRSEPLVFLDSLKEANLLFLEGMRNVDAKEQYPEAYRAWREDPINFQVDGVFPVVNLWDQAKDAWREILSAKGELILVVTHKSILRALMCTALGMGPDRFRAMDINNGGISVFTVNTRGEPLLQCLNMTAHMHTEGVFY